MMLIDQIQQYSDDELELEVDNAVRKLRPQQRKIIEIYATGEHTLKSSAEQAGFKTGSAASNVVKSPAGAWALQVLREYHARKSNVSAEWKRNRLRDIVNIAMTAEKPDLRSAVSAIGELNKMSGDHAITRQKVEHTLVAARVELDSLDMELLAKLHHTLENHDGRIIEGTVTQTPRDTEQS